MLHVDEGIPLTLGADVSVGHHAMLHGCTVEDGALVGINAVVLNHAVIGRGSLVGAGALVPEGKVIPERSLAVGSPVRVVRTLTDEDAAGIERIARHYVEKADGTARSCACRNEANDDHGTSLRPPFPRPRCGPPDTRNGANVSSSSIDWLRDREWFGDLARIDAVAADPAWIETVHDAGYIAPRGGDLPGRRAVPRRGRRRVSRRSSDVARLAAGGALALADRIVAGDVENGFALSAPPGHHAERGHGPGLLPLQQRGDRGPLPATRPRAWTRS